MNNSAIFPYESEKFDFFIDNRKWVFQKPAKPETLMDLLTEKQFEKDRFLPYWAEFWPASEALLRHVLEINLPVKMDVCDLGCGLGALSAALSFRKNNVVACDISFDAGLYTLQNSICNSASVKFVCSDWRTPPFKKKFDLITAADILYEKQCFEPVMNFLGSTLKNEGFAIIADPCRALWNKFKDEIQCNGFIISELHKQVLNNGKTTVEIAHIQKNNSI